MLPKANKIFADRIGPKALIESNIKAFELNQFRKKILCLYGIGGIGKSRFLKEVKYQNKFYPLIRFVHISLAVYELDSPVKVLLSIRRQLGSLDLTIFDYAMILYFKKNGLSSKEVLDSFTDTKSTAADLFKGIVDTTGDFIPYFGLFKKILGNIKDLTNYVAYKKHESDFQYIDNLDIDHLYDLLPSLLSKAINLQTQKIIFFMDDYESMMAKMKDKIISINFESWLINLYKALDDIYLVIASREKLKWSLQYKELSPDIDQYYLDKLSEKDADDFLRQIPINDDQTRHHIVDLCEGLPLCLDMCVDLYVSEQASNQSVSLQGLSFYAIIDRYLRHLRQDERTLTMYLSYLNTFEFDFVKYLAKSTAIALSDVDTQEYLEKSLIIDTGNYKKLDSTVKSHIFDNGLNKQVEGVCQLIKCYLTELCDFEHENYLHYFKQLVYLFGNHKLDITLSDIEFLTYTISRFADRGYIREIKDVIYTAHAKNTALKPIEDYFTLLQFRKEGRISEGLAYLNDIKGTTSSHSFGKMSYAFDLLTIMLKHLSGDYDYAYKGYKQLLEDHELLGILQDDPRTYHLAYIKYCDLLFLKGNFKESLHKANTLSIRTINESENVMELLRIKGHIYRFNYQLEHASKVYQYILSKESDKDIRLKANAYTNLAETYQMEDPNKAIEYANKALELHTLLNSRIEIGKTKTALIYAYAKLGMFDEALTNLIQSKTIQQQNGYRAGILFALVGEVYLYYKQGKTDKDLTNLLEEIKILQKQISVYQFLLALIQILYPSFESDLGEVSFLNKEEMILKLTSII